MVCVRRVLKNACACRPSEACRLALLQRRDHRVLLRAVELRERLACRSCGNRHRARKPASIEILQVGIGAGEREIDVVGDARVVCAGLAGRARHDALGEGRDGGGIVVIEEGSVSADLGMRGGRVGGGIGVLRLRGLRQSLGARGPRQRRLPRPRL